MLDGIRIIDLSTVIMGPLASRMLADLGADVVKVESPNGDSTRAYRPHMAPGISGMFLNLNRNKRSIVLDLKSEQGKRTLEDLVRGADIFLHNLRPSVMRRLGFDYARCRELNPHLIYCGAYGFGIGGPYSEKPAYDDLIQAASGFAALSHELSGAPSYAPSVICDKIAGQAIAMSILAALFHRSKTGEGQAIE
ncbi:acyl-CoA transferase/carnitine dehydratase, partial [Medicago truncatula]